MFAVGSEGMCLLMEVDPCVPLDANACVHTHMYVAACMCMYSYVYI